MRAFNAPPLESSVERPAVAKAKRLGWDCIKVLAFHGNKKSRPDRLFWRLGCYVWIEFKRPGDEPTEAQYREHDRMRENGCNVFWTDNEEGALEILAECWAIYVERQAADL